MNPSRSHILCGESGTGKSQILLYRQNRMLLLNKRRAEYFSNLGLDVSGIHSNNLNEKKFDDHYDDEWINCTDDLSKVGLIDLEYVPGRQLEVYLYINIFIYSSSIIFLEIFDFPRPT